MKRLLAIILFCLLLMTTGPVFATTGTEGIFTTEEETGSALSFEADSFSVYGVVYTVTYGDFEYEMLGNQETSLSELLSVLNTGIEIEEVVDVSSSGNGVMVSWLEDESDWLIKLLGEEEEIAEAPSTLTIKIASEREITITLTAVGLREIDLDGTIIKSADGLYLPEEAGGHSFIREEAEETIKAVEEFAAAETSAAKAFDEETAISASSEEAETSFSANAEENVFSSSEDAAEEDEADRHYTVFEIGLDNVDLENYANGFEVSVPLPESIFGKDFKLYHVHEGEVNEVGDLSVEDGMISFSTDSFSEFVLSYTVDFHWEVNGKIYDFSIPGGGFISLRQLVEILGIANDGLIDEDNRGAAITLNNPDVSEQTRKFVADVASVQFSDPSLVWIGKVDKASTVGELKNANGLNCQYSIELSEEQIAEINSSLVEAGDWALISLSPFTSEESLTVTMKDGVSFVIRVTDANANARKASLIWASNIQDGQKLVIYQKVIQADDSIYYYAIDGNGNLQRVYNSSDSVYWLNDLPIEWKITVLKDGSGNPTGYYTLYNETTHTYLVPKDDDGRYRVVHKLSDFSDGNTKNLEVSLPGKDAGQYLSKIASWDYDANVTYGIEVLSANDVHAKELLSSQDFYFAVPDNIVQGQLTQVETVNSLDKGIKITMYDFDSNEWQREPEPRYTFMTRTIGDSGYTEGLYIPGLVKPRLGSDGFPVSVATNQSIKPVFESQGNYSPADSNSWPPNYGTTDYYYNVSKTENVNHLFLQSVYDATGYFYYSCFENFAKLNGNNFLVYEQLGTPYDGDDFFYKRGNFMPFNSLDLSHKKENITSSSSSSQLGMDNPRRGEDLYVVSGAADYYFGMTMEADFLQGPNGYNDRDEPTVFEFNGDDDLWIFIDGVLVLDIGGVHDAFQGTIDFKTGDVIVTADNGVSTTIKEMFRAARVFPDGTSWNENRVSEYFSGNTFKDYSTHSFKMFYMERGARASNLEMKFNMMTVKESSFRVTKQMSETVSHGVIQSDYEDAIFYYRAYLGTAVCTKQAFEATAKYTDGTPVIWKDNTTFQLKPGQTAIFPVASNTVRYHVEEVEPETGSTMLNNYYVTNTDPEAGQQEGKETVSSEKSVQQRGEVVFTNKPNDNIVNELRIIKNLTGEMYTDEAGNLLVNEETNSPYFEYRIYLENTAGKMVYYSLGEYYQVDIDGKYVYYEKGVRKTAEYRDGKYIYTYNDGTVEELDSPKITEHTSQNGTIGDIRHGDTIIIKGLLEGTDFVVDERTDRSLMLKGTSGEDPTDKYSFDGTSVEDAYIRATGENTPAHLTGTLYNPPDTTGASYSNKAATGTIIQDKDAKVTVNNSSQLIDTDLSLKKVSQKGEALEGAVFKLMKGSKIVPVSSNWDRVVVLPLDESEEVTIADNTFTVPKGGVIIKNIPSGKISYTLVEISAPSGYVITSADVATLGIMGGIIEMKNSVDGVTFGNDIIVIPNEPGAALPATGGPGTILFYLVGFALTMLAAAGCVMKRAESRGQVP